MLRRTAIALLLALAVVPIAPATRAGAQSGELIRVGTGPNDEGAPLFYAAQAGIFKKYGLNVEVQRLGGGAVIAAALASGSLELGKGSAASVVTAFARGLPFTAIGSIANYNPDHPDTALLVRADSPIKTAQDLVGQTLGAVTLQDMGTIATYAWLGQRGIDFHSLKFVELPVSAMLTTMLDNRIVAAPVYEPSLSADLAAGKVRALGYPMEAISRHFSEALMFGNVSWVNAHRDQVDRFLHALAESAAYVTAHEREVVPLIAGFEGVDPADLARVSHPIRGVTLGPSDVQPVIDTLAKYKVIAAPFAAQDMICSCALRK